MKKVFLLLIFTFLFLTGCINYTELNDLSIVNTIGIEKIKDIYKVTISVVDTNNYENDDNYKKEITQATGNNLTDAFNNLYTSLDKEIYIHHLETLLLSSSLTYQDIDHINTYFNNRKNNRNSFTVLYTNSDIKEILESNVDINSLIETNSNNSSLVYPLTYENYLKVLYEKKYSFIPTITYSNNSISVLGYSYFYKNKYINLLTKEENRSYNILNNHINTLSLSIDNKYYLISSLDCNTQLHNTTKNILINSYIYSEEKNYIEKYNQYIKDTLDHFIDKYNYFQDYKIKLYTKGEIYEK